jgi:hypothetical protein
VKVTITNTALAKFKQLSPNEDASASLSRSKLMESDEFYSRCKKPNQIRKRSRGDELFYHDDTTNVVWIVVKDSSGGEDYFAVTAKFLKRKLITVEVANG